MTEASTIAENIVAKSARQALGLVGNEAECARPFLSCMGMLNPELKKALLEQAYSSAVAKAIDDELARMEEESCCRNSATA